MRNVIHACGLALMVVGTSASADSFLRIKCYDNDIGANVYINNKLVGACPVDAPSPAGMVQLRAHKMVDNDYEQVFENQVKVIDGVPQKIEITLSAPQITAEARHRNEVAEAKKQLNAAQVGDIAAMEKVAKYYDAGIGVEKDSGKAKYWHDKATASLVAARNKAETEAAQVQLRGAEAGNVADMEGMASRYGTGTGVVKDSVMAQNWHAKAEAEKQKNIAMEKERRRQAEIDKISFVEFTADIAFDKPAGGNGGNQRMSEVFGPAYYTSYPTSLVDGTIFDLTSAPTKSTRLYELKTEATIHPSAWGKPESMIARASRQLHDVVTEQFVWVDALAAK
jgi:TPR repeat protein